MHENNSSSVNYLSLRFMYKEGACEDEEIIGSMVNDPRCSWLVRHRLVCMFAMNEEMNKALSKKGMNDWHGTCLYGTSSEVEGHVGNWRT